jgi:hypothetical protein
VLTVSFDPWIEVDGRLIHRLLWLEAGIRLHNMPKRWMLKESKCSLWESSNRFTLWRFNNTPFITHVVPKIYCLGPYPRRGALERPEEGDFEIQMDVHLE